MALRDEVIKVLKQIYDPEIPVNIYDLGLIYGLEIEGDKIHIKMTLTAPGCPLAGYLQQEVKNRLESIKGISEANVEIVWEPRWNISMLTEEGKEALRAFGFNI